MLHISLGFTLMPSAVLADTPYSPHLHSLAAPRYMKLSVSGTPLSDQQATFEQLPWSCVYDRSTHLIWEVKSLRPGLHHYQETYAWFNSSHRNNNDKQQDNSTPPPCLIQPCNSNTYIQSTNNEAFCGLNQWRLPTREELRSLVDYSIKYPGPTIDAAFFPHTVNQFYWSSVPYANNNESAWGVGFSFGYDYAYYKSNLARIRLVHESIK